MNLEAYEAEVYRNHVDTLPPVRYINAHGYDQDLEHARQYLTPGKIYEVESIDIGSWTSTIELKEFPGIRFNTVHFENVL